MSVVPGRNTTSLAGKLLVLSNVSFLVLFAILSWFNRISEDDYRFLWHVNTSGILQGTIAEYNTWCTRYASVFLSDITLSFITCKYTLFISGLIEITAFVLSLAFLLRAVLQHFPQLKPDNISTLSIALLFTNGFFYTGPDVSMTWFWLTATFTYIWSIIALFLFCALVLHKSIKPLLRYIGIALSLLYIGGAFEGLAAFLALCISIILVRIFINKNNSGKAYLKAFYIALPCVVLALAILIMGHGNMVRRQFTPHLSLLATLVQNFKVLSFYALKRLPSTMPYTLLFSVPFAWLGYTVAVKNTIQAKRPKEIVIQLLKYTVLCIVMVYVYHYPICYLLGVLGPARSFAFVSLLVFIWSAGSFFYMGSIIVSQYLTMPG